MKSIFRRNNYFLETNGIPCEIRTDIEAARDEIQDAQEEILQTEMKVKDTAQRIEGIAVDMYDRQGSTDRWGELKTTPENRTRNISRDEDDPYQY